MLPNVVDFCARVVCRRRSKLIFVVAIVAATRRHSAAASARVVGGGVFSFFTIFSVHLDCRHRFCARSHDEIAHFLSSFARSPACAIAVHRRARAKLCVCGAAFAPMRREFAYAFRHRCGVSVIFCASERAPLAFDDARAYLR